MKSFPTITSSRRAARLLCPLVLAAATTLTPLQATAQPTAADIASAAYDGGALPEDRSALTARVQILLDRHGVSPGVVDGIDGENVAKALRAFETMTGFPVDGQIDPDVWAALNMSGDALVVEYTVTQDDAADIAPPHPDDYAELATLDWLGYTSVAEKLAERFHMDVDFLRALNPDADIETPGTRLYVVDPGAPVTGTVSRIVADKSVQQLYAYDEAGKLLVAYPVTIGSDELPSPAGVHEVVAIAVDPTYTYDPDVNFVQGDNRERLTIPPGPNGPVGSVWIDLSEPTYGIHGSPEPATIDKTQSHGCVRLTNWDAGELVEMVQPGVVVEFRE